MPTSSYARLTDDYELHNVDSDGLTYPDDSRKAPREAPLCGESLGKAVAIPRIVVVLGVVFLVVVSATSAYYAGKHAGQESTNLVSASGSGGGSGSGPSSSPPPPTPAPQSSTSNTTTPIPSSAVQTPATTTAAAGPAPTAGATQSAHVKASARHLRAILEDRSPTVTPCEDFFQHTCEGWLARHPVSPDNPLEENLNTVGQAVTKQEFQLMQDNWPFLETLFAQCLEEPVEVPPLIYSGV